MTKDKDMSEQSNERELFEAWAHLHAHDTSRPSLTGDYFHRSTKLAWRAWQAARAPLLARIAELEAKVANMTELLRESRDDVFECLQNDMHGAGYERYDRRIEFRKNHIAAIDVAIQEATNDTTR